MNVLKIILNISLTILIASCNFDSAEESASGGGLFINNKEVQNKFALIPPSPKTYVEGENIDLVLQHAANINVTGTPRLELDIGGNIVNADYLAGSGTKNLTFRYTIAAGDDDTDGIQLNSQSIDLNGGTLDFTLDSVVTNADLNFIVLDFQNLKVDTTAPQITVVAPPSADTYYQGQQLNFTVLFNDIVTVSGTPRIQLNVGGNTVYAEYFSGSGSLTLYFRYIVQGSDVDLDGIAMLSPMELNGGSITDSNGNDSTLIFTPIPMVTTYVDGDIPFVSNLIAPVNNTYLNTETLSLSVQFSEDVVVTGAPRVEASIGTNTRYFYYISGSGTDELLFQYTAQESDDDLNGIALGNSIDLNGGTIQDLGAVSADISLAPPLLPNVRIDAGNANITDITLPADATYVQGNELYFTVTFDRNVTITGTPRLPITLTSGTVYANYISGSGSDEIVFRYQVQAGELDMDGLTIQNTLDLNAGSIVATNTINANLDITSVVAGLTTSGIIINAGGASVSSITPPADTNHTTGNNLDFIITFTKAVDVTGTPRIVLDIGGVTKYATYQTGTGTTFLTFRYTVVAPDTDSDGIEIANNLIDLNGGTINDSGASPADLDMSLYIPVMTSVNVNYIALTISSVTAPANATYTETQNIDFLVNTSENVDVTGTPRIAMDIGGVSKYADYAAGTGTSTLTFRYTVESGLDDSDGISIVTPLELNSGTIQNSSLQNLDLAFTAPVLTGVLVDSVVPTITSITPPADATYLEAQDIDFIVNTDEAINVVGTPRIAIDIGGVTKYADYISGTGSMALTFRYNVESGLDDSDGISITSPIDLNAGTLRNATLEDLNLTFTAPAMPAVLVDAAVPTITSVNAPVDATYGETQTLTFTINTSEIINIAGGTPQIAIDIGGVTKYATYQSGTGTSALVFEYTIEAGLEDTDGITITTPLEDNGATLQSASVRNLDLNFTSPVLTAVLVDSATPTIAITSPIDNSYINTLNDSATFTISGTCSENLKTVVIEVDGGASTSPVDFVCDGTNFTGTIDTTGLSEATHTLVAKITDDSLNEGISTTINVVRDITAPTITSITTPANGWFIEAQNLDFIVNLDENTDVSGNPQIEINLGGSSAYAVANSGTGTSALTFRYTIAPSDEDTDGLSFVGTTIDLNLGSLSDAAGNPININMDATVGLPDISGVLVDAVIPTVTITSAPDITAANENNYLVSGTCSEDGRIVNVNIDSIPLTPTCSSGAWTSGAVNVSGRPDNASFPISANHSDLAGNNALTANTTVNKDAATPTVVITNAVNITSANLTTYSVSGTCTETGVAVTVDIGPGPLTFNPNCTGGTWTTGFIDVTTVPDNASVTITASHDVATPDSTIVSKDTLSATVTISSAVNISLSNQTNYSVSGTCSENGTMVDVYIDTLNYQPNCSGGSWSTGLQDVSSLLDGTITITADHGAATQASLNVVMNTATPTVANLSSPTTLTTTVDLSWNLNDPSPGSFTIDDYEINYRTKGTSTWLSFNDGISTNTTATVTGLIASTIYEFRVRLLYDTSSLSDWSNIAEGETKPDDPLFDSPYAAMNVGGSTSTSVVAYYDNTAVTLNGVAIAASPLSKGQTAIITTSQFDVIDADKPIFTAGILGSGNGGNGANMVWLPTSWAGRSFSFNSTRANPQNLFVYATENATIQVKQGSTVLASTTLTAGNGATLNWSVYGSYQVVSTGTILALHMSGSGTTRYDPKPILPGHTEIIGFPSNSMRLTADLDATNYNLIHSNSSSTGGSLNKIDVIQVNPLGGTTTLYQSESLLISADRKISGASFADSNGLCAAPFLPTNLMKTRYVINATSDYVAFASKQAGTISVYSPAQTIGVDTPVATLNFTRSGANTNAPYRARFGTYTAGHRFVSTVPMAGWYHPSVEVGSAPNDETILYGTND